MRDGAVEADVVAEGEAPLVAPAHRDQPAAGADIDGDAVAGTIAPDCLNEDSLAACHLPQPFVSISPGAKSRKNAGIGAKRGGNQSYS
jgi:hypothetical protein